MGLAVGQVRKLRLLLLPGCELGTAGLLRWRRVCAAAVCGTIYVFQMHADRDPEADCASERRPSPIARAASSHSDALCGKAYRLYIR